MFKVRLNASATLAEFPSLENAVEASLWFHKAINVDHFIVVVEPNGSVRLTLSAAKSSK